MSRKNKQAQGARSSHRKLWIVLAVAVVIVAAVAAWYLMRYKFNYAYRAYITEPEALETAAAYQPLAEEASSVPGYDLVAQNDTLKLYAKADTGEVAVYDLRNGSTVYSNPPDSDQDKKANKTNKNYLKSQFLLDYYNAGLTSSTYDSYSMSVSLGNLTAESIQNGVRFTYELGEDAIKYFTPSMLPDARFQELHEQLDTSTKGRMDKVYEQREDGSWWLTESGKKSARDLAKLSQEFVKLGVTKEEYLALEAEAGTEIVESLGFTVVLEWRLKADGVECTVPAGQIQERGGGKVRRIQLLPYLGAAGTEETGYMVVPNGSGSLLYFNNGKSSASVYSQYIYGLDLVDSEYTQTQLTQMARLPIFGICREDSSVLVSIEKGATLCNITASVAGRNNSYNSIYPIFTLRNSELLSMFGSGDNTEMPVVEADYYHETITVRYTLLTAENKGYSGLANYYRARLINEGWLSEKTEGGAIPFYYDVIGGVKETAHFLGVQYLHVMPMTTFSQADEIAQQLNKAGVKHQVMNFQGWMNGGYYHDVPDKVKVLSQLGGKDALEELNASMVRMGGKLYADVAFQNVNILSKRYRTNEETSRYYGAGYVAQFGALNPATLRRTSGLGGYSELIYNLLSPKFLPRYVEGFLNATKDYQLTGISLRDLGDELHADKRRTEFINREEALMVVQAELENLRQSGRELMLSGGNQYALKGASHVLNAPLYATEYFILDESVPLYEMIVHGCVDYTGTALNNVASDNSRADLLHLVEYGASTHYIFTWENASKMKYTGMKRYFSTTFETWKDKAVEQYQYVNEALAPVSNAQMVEHVSLSDTLKRVAYSNGITLYINYGTQDAQADGYTVPAMDYLKVGGVTDNEK